MDGSITYHDLIVAFFGDGIKIIFDVALGDDVKMSDEDIKATLDNKLRERYPSATTLIDVDRNYIG